MTKCLVLGLCLRWHGLNCHSIWVSMHQKYFALQWYKGIRTNILPIMLAVEIYKERDRESESDSNRECCGGMVLSAFVRLDYMEYGDLRDKCRITSVPSDLRSLTTDSWEPITMDTESQTQWGGGGLCHHERLISSGLRYTLS